MKYKNYRLKIKISLLKVHSVKVENSSQRILFRKTYQVASIRKITSIIVTTLTKFPLLLPFKYLEGCRLKMINLVKV